MKTTSIISFFTLFSIAPLVDAATCHETVTGLSFQAQSATSTDLSHSIESPGKILIRTLKGDAKNLGAIRYDLITSDQFAPAFELGLKAAKRRLRSVRTNTSAPTFENTVEAIEFVDEPLQQISSTFYNYLAMRSDKTLETLAEKIGPRVSAFSNSIWFDQNLFSRVENVYQSRAKLGLSSEQTTLLENTYRGFIKNGARLNSAQKNVSMKSILKFQN